MIDFDNFRESAAILASSSSLITSNTSAFSKKVRPVSTAFAATEESHL